VRSNEHPADNHEAPKVLGDVADAVIVLFREREDAWLADLRSQLAPAQEKRRESQRRLAEAKAEEWHLHQLGQHVQITADDGAFGRQPAPLPEEPPKQFSADVAESMLERPWHKCREAEELPRSWQEQSEDDVEPLDAEDETGVVSELEDNGAVA
jgi:hypothetical protein